MRTAALGLLFCVAGFLLFTGLNEPTLWDDEAHVALFAKNYLQTGKWSGWDGRNYVPDRGGILGFHEDNTTLLYQLDYSAAALSFKLFGVSVRSARLPFALAGWLTLLVFYLWLKERIPEERTVHYFALAGTIGSVSFLMANRSCRYYALAGLMVVTLLWSWEKLRKTATLLPALLIGAAASLLCFSSILICCAVGPALALWVLIFDRKSLTKPVMTKLAMAGALFAAAVAPYFISDIVPTMRATKIFESMQQPAGQMPAWQNHSILFLWNLQGLDLINAFPFLLVVLFAAVFFEWNRSKRKSKLPALYHFACQVVTLVVLYVLFLSIASPQPVAITRFADVRYFFPLLPIITCLAAIVFARIYETQRVASVALFCVFITTNTFSMVPWSEDVKWLLPAYAKEMFQPQNTAVSQAAAYLREHANENDSYWIFPEYMGKPMLFLLGDKMRNTAIFAPASVEPKQLAELRPDLVIDHATPDWLVSFGLQPQLPQIVNFFSRARDPAVPASAPQYEVAAVLPVYFDQTQRPELPLHEFGGKKSFDHSVEGVFILKKRPMGANSQPVAADSPH